MTDQEAREEKVVIHTCNGCDDLDNCPYEEGGEHAGEACPWLEEEIEVSRS